MILLSPEIAYLFRLMKWGMDTISVYDSKIKYKFCIYKIPISYSRRRLIKNIRNLETLGLIKVLYMTHRMIEIEVSQSIVKLIEKMAKKFDKCSFEFNTIGLRFIIFLMTCPYDKTSDALSGALGISIRGIRKCIKKLYCLGLINKKLDVTDTGINTIDIFTSTPLSKSLSISLVTDPLLSLSLLAPKVKISTLVGNIKKIIRDIIKFNEKLGQEFDKILFLSISDKTRVPSFVNYLSYLIDMPTYILPLTYPARKMNNVIRRTCITQTKLLNLLYKNIQFDASKFLNTYPREIWYISELIENSSDNKTLVVLFAPYAIAFPISYFLAGGEIENKITSFSPKTSRSVIVFFRLDDSINYLANNINEITSLKQLHKFLYDAFRNMNTIEILWNYNTEYPSKIRIRVCKKINPDRIFTLEDGDLTNTNFSIVPLGELRLQNLSYLSRLGIIDILGEINILGEPIIGLKKSKEKWINEKNDKPDLSFIITAEKGSQKLKVKKSSYGYLRRILNDGSIYGIHFGGNRVECIYDDFSYSPIVQSRTKHFIQILFIAPTIINPDILTCYHLFVNNAEVIIDGEVVWRTI